MEDEYPVSTLQCLISYSCTTLSFGLLIAQTLLTPPQNFPSVRHEWILSFEQSQDVQQCKHWGQGQFLAQTTGQSWAAFQ